jgi:hypothetical protein
MHLVILEVVRERCFPKNYLERSRAKVISSNTSNTNVRDTPTSLNPSSLTLVQLYIPPEYMLNKDFLKEVFENRKKLLKLNEVIRVNVPKYDELSVKQLWPHLKEDLDFMQYFPSKLPKGRMPDRECKFYIASNLSLDFFNILNTLQEDYC